MHLCKVIIYAFHILLAKNLAYSKIYCAIAGVLVKSSHACLYRIKDRMLLLNYRCDIHDRGRRKDRSEGGR